MSHRFKENWFQRFMRTHVFGWYFTTEYGRRYPEPHRIKNTFPVFNWLPLLFLMCTYGRKVYFDVAGIDWIVVAVAMVLNAFAFGYSLLCHNRALVRVDPNERGAMIG